MSVSILNNLRVWNAEIYNVDANPSIGGLAAAITSLAVDPNGVIYSKTGPLDTDWTALSTPSGGGGAIPNKYVAYVNKNGNDGTGAVDDISKPFLTVQAAINACDIAGYNTVSSKANIFISPGTYTEDLTLISNINLCEIGRAHV